MVGSAQHGKRNSSLAPRHRPMYMPQEYVLYVFIRLNNFAKVIAIMYQPDTIEAGKADLKGWMMHEQVDRTLT